MGFFGNSELPMASLFAPRSCHFAGAVSEEHGEALLGGVIIEVLVDIFCDEMNGVV